MTRFHCTKSTDKAARKAKHSVVDECSHLKAVLRANPEYGEVVPGTRGLRKMRVRVKGFRGQRGGYRAIYSKHDSEDGIRIAFHSVYSKSDVADLDHTQYAKLAEESAALAKNLDSVNWED